MFRTDPSVWFSRSYVVIIKVLGPEKYQGTIYLQPQFFHIEFVNSCPRRCAPTATYEP
jgi:hypothetical protein